MVHFSASAADNCVFHIHQDGGTNALAAWGDYTTGDGPHTFYGNHYMSAGTTSSTTFALRAGATGSGGSNTIRINSNSGSRLFGGASDSWILIMEIGA